jgi:C4-dicarboxylate transporter DctM subunit
MSGTLGSILGLVVFLGLLFGGLWIPFAIAAAGMAAMVASGGLVSLKALGFVTWSAMNSSTLSAIPLFILMADILLRAGVSDRFYNGLSLLVRRLPGGLLQTNIAGCALFAAISGSSVATAASIGTVAIPQLKAKGYNHAMTAGSLAAGGTLGILIPPSIAMIIYGSFTEVSVAKLFLAGLIPGIVLTLIFMTYIGVHAWLKPEVAPRTQEDRVGLRGIAIGFAQLLPLILLMTLVIGTIYAGIATPTEAAALGTVGSLIIGSLFGTMNMKVLRDSLTATLKVSAAILFITMAAFIFAYGMEKGGVGKALTDWVAGLGLSTNEFLLVLLVGYALLGCVVDSIGMIVLTIPLLTPILNAMGIDLIWFGIALVVVVELGQITPPLGVNLFVIESIAKRGLLEVIRGTVPYYFLMVAFLFILAIFPALATWLPTQMSGR